MFLSNFVSHRSAAFYTSSFLGEKKHTDDVKSLFKYDFQKKEKDVILY